MDYGPEAEIGYTVSRGREFVSAGYGLSEQRRGRRLGLCALGIPLKAGAAYLFVCLCSRLH